MSRRIGATRKISLASIAEGWDDCYVVVTLMSKQDAIDWDAMDIASKSADELLDIEGKIAKDHFVSGKIMVVDDDGSLKLDDMVADDIDSVARLADFIVMGILGVAPDPKGSSTTTETSPTSEPTETPLTSTSSTSQPSSTETSAK